MHFKIRGEAIQGQYHLKVLKDTSHYYNIEYIGEGLYSATDRNNRLITSNLEYKDIKLYTETGTWEIFDKMPIFEDDTRETKG